MYIQLANFFVDCASLALIGRLISLYADISGCQ